MSNAIVHYDAPKPKEVRRWVLDECDIWEVDWLGNRKRWIARMNAKEARIVIEMWNARETTL